MKMREHNTTADPDKAHLLYNTILERDRLTLVLRDWTTAIPVPYLPPIRAAVFAILTEVKHDG